MSLKARIERLERRRERGDMDPRYLSVPDEAALKRLKESGRVKRFCKVYVGVSPDDWDE